MKSCPACGADVPFLARSCPDCGAPNATLRMTIAITIAIAVLLPAIALAVFVATRWDQPLISGGPASSDGSQAQTVTAKDDNFEWLAMAMKACDEKAASEQNALHLLVIPIAHSADVVDQWRRRALNRIGNALVLPGSETLTALRRKELAIATEPYVFGLRDDTSGNVRRWDKSSGVKWFSIADAENVTLFKLQYRPNNRGRDDLWGNSVVHNKGNCYWVAVLYED